MISGRTDNGTSNSYHYHLKRCSCQYDRVRGRTHFTFQGAEKQAAPKYKQSAEQEASLIDTCAIKNSHLWRMAAEKISAEKISAGHLLSVMSAQPIVWVFIAYPKRQLTMPPRMCPFSISRVTPEDIIQSHEGSVATLQSCMGAKAAPLLHGDSGELVPASTSLGGSLPPTPDLRQSCPSETITIPHAVRKCKYCRDLYHSTVL